MSQEADIEGVTESFYREGRTDGLPVVPPTEERVERMLEGTDLPSDEVLGRLGTREGTLTVEKLAVNGVMKTKEIIVTDQAGDWPDYVFSPGYELMSLDELELFVYANRHLPGIPDQAQIEREGQNVGEIQRMLLEKVEELTLHVIAMKKENGRSLVRSLMHPGHKRGLGLHRNVQVLPFRRQRFCIRPGMKNHGQYLRSIQK